MTSTSYDIKKQTLSLLSSQDVDIEITPFGIDLDLFKPINHLKNDRIIEIGIVKTLEETYGVKYLIEVMAIVLSKLKSIDYQGKPVYLEIVGSGSLKESLQSRCEELNISEYVTFIDRIPNVEVPLKLNTFDIYCAPSLSESFGVAIIEASACEVPVVVTRVGGLKEVVVHEETGLIVESKDINGIADALIKLVLNEPLRKLYGKNGRDFIKKLYNWEDNVIEMERVYSKCVAGGVKK